MKTIVIAGGTGFLGSCLINHYTHENVKLVVLTRGESRISGKVQYTNWDGKSPGPWTETLEGAEVVINLNGKSVDCRYNEKNKRLIYASRLDATSAIGKAIQQCVSPPRLWINAASATIYRHSLDKDMDEYTGEMGSGFSVDVCQKWEAAFNTFETPQTRKVLVRTGIVLGKKGGPLRPLKALTKIGLGGRQGPGNQYFSWLHEDDFVNIIDFIINTPTAAGAYNVTAPFPVPNEHVMRALRVAVGIPFGIPLPAWLLEVGAILIRTETELVLKSRRVVPKRLLDAGYKFHYQNIESALSNLV